MKKLHKDGRFQCIIHHFCDGDTVQVLFECDHCFKWELDYLRIRGIESEELKSPDVGRAKQIAKELTEKYKGQSGELFLTQSNSDKYGRMIGDIMIHNKMLSETLVEQGYAWYTRQHPQLHKSEK